MSFTDSLLVVLTLVTVLLTFGFAAHQRTLAQLVETVNARPPGAGWHGPQAGLSAGERLRLPVPDHDGLSVVLFGSPGCADCHEILGRVRELVGEAPGSPRIVSLWNGAAPAWARDDPSVVVVEEASLFDTWGIVRTPAVAVLDGDVVRDSSVAGRPDVAVELVERQLAKEEPR